MCLQQCFSKTFYYPICCLEICMPLMIMQCVMVNSNVKWYKLGAISRCLILPENAPTKKQSLGIANRKHNTA